MATVSPGLDPAERPDELPVPKPDNEAISPESLPKDDLDMMQGAETVTGLLDVAQALQAAASPAAVSGSSPQDHNLPDTAASEATSISERTMGVSAVDSAAGQLLATLEVNASIPHLSPSPMLPPQHETNGVGSVLPAFALDAQQSTNPLSITTNFPSGSDMLLFDPPAGEGFGERIPNTLLAAMDAQSRLAAAQISAYAKLEFNDNTTFYLRHYHVWLGREPSNGSKRKKGSGVSESHAEEASTKIKNEDEQKPDAKSISAGDIDSTNDKPDVEAPKFKYTLSPDTSTVYIRPEDPSNSGHGISRRHVKISYNFTLHCFELAIMGLNGAFVNGKFHTQGAHVPLKNGYSIQIGGVWMQFFLPNTGEEEQEVDWEDEAEASSGEIIKVGGGKRMSLSFMDENGHEDEDISDDELINPQETVGFNGTWGSDGSGSSSDDDEVDSADDIHQSGESGSEEEDSDEEEESSEEEEDEPTPPPSKRRRFAQPDDYEPPRRGRKPTIKIKKLTPKQKSQQLAQARADAKRKSEEEAAAKKERERQKAEASKRPPGGDRPPPPKGYIRGPYKKRPRNPDGTLMYPPALYNADGTPKTKAQIQKEPKPPRVKKYKRTPSPAPPEAELPPEKLEKPTWGYVYLIFEAIINSAEKCLTLPDIYRAIMRNYPYFRYRVSTNGWQSSVRHNLSSHHAFEKRPKEGKGGLWVVRDGVTVEKEKKKPTTVITPTPGQAHPHPNQHTAHYYAEQRRKEAEEQQRRAAQAYFAQHGTYPPPGTPLINGVRAPGQPPPVFQPAPQYAGQNRPPPATLPSGTIPVGHYPPPVNARPAGPQAGPIPNTNGNTIPRPPMNTPVYVAPTAQMQSTGPRQPAPPQAIRAPMPGQPRPVGAPMVAAPARPAAHDKAVIITRLRDLAATLVKPSEKQARAVAEQLIRKIEDPNSNERENADIYNAFMMSLNQVRSKTGTTPAKTSASPAPRPAPVQHVPVTQKPQPQQIIANMGRGDIERMLKEVDAVAAKKQGTPGLVPVKVEPGTSGKA